jgi:two-component system, NtrC family, sensor kinase
MFLLQHLLDYRLDTVLFAVLALASGMLIGRWLRKNHSCSLPPWVKYALAVLGLLGVVGAEFSQRQETQRLSGAISGIAPTYAAEMSLHRHDLLRLDTPADDPTYQAIIDSQKMWLAVNPQVSDIYTFRKDADGKLRFIADSETDYDRNGQFSGDRESRTPIGEIWDSDSGAASRALAGKSVMDSQPITDRWGTWVSAYAPIYGPDGKVEAALGVDFPAATWLALIAWHRLSALLLVGIMQIAFLAVVVVVLVTRAELAKRETLQLQTNKLHEQFIDASRQAGMAEIATGVLHNVGNVLNSVNVSARVVAESIKNSRVPSIGKLAELIVSQKSDLTRFVSEDPRGKCLPEYLQQLHAKLAADQATVLAELEQLTTGIDHIKEVVRMQQGCATNSNLLTPSNPVSIMEDALKVNLISMERHQIELVRDYATNITVIPLDKHKILQILINLISNAKKATCSTEVPSRRITLRVGKSIDRRSIEFRVEDNGVGFTPDVAQRLFRHGFHAFESGHGFGLHSGANAATEMKGSLTAHSEGPGRGAVFTLTVPLVQVQSQGVAA